MNLGYLVSAEHEADYGADMDGINNLVPDDNDSDNDGADDGVQMPAHLCALCSHNADILRSYLCGRSPTRLRQCLVRLEPQRCLGENDTRCTDTVLAPEWAVQNYEVNWVGPRLLGFCYTGFSALQR